MKKLYLLLSIALAINVVQATEDTHLAKAKEFVDLNPIEEMMEQMAESFSLNPQFQQLNVDYKEFLKQITQASKESTTKLYKKYFTEKELDDISTFYKTDTGKKFLATAPTIAIESSQELMPKVIDFMQNATKKAEKVEVAATK